MDLDFAADGNLRELSGEEAWEAIKNFTQGQKEWDKPPNIISEQELANLKAQAERLFGNKNVWVDMHRGIAWDKVGNLNHKVPPQVLSSLRIHTVSDFTERSRRDYWNPDGVNRKFHSFETRSVNHIPYENYPSLRWLYLIRRSLEVLKKFHWTILGG
ncbi:hypothetical protein Tco_0007638 [Tanacetum coccineum]